VCNKDDEEEYDEELDGDGVRVVEILVKVFALDSLGGLITSLSLLSNDWL
jgi:hypothetical protein